MTQLNLTTTEADILKTAVEILKQNLAKAEDELDIIISDDEIKELEDKLYNEEN